MWSTDKNSRISHKNGCNMTVHRDYANKSCPGEYIYSRLGKIAEEVNQNLGVKEATATKFEPYKVRIGIDDLRIRTTPEVRTGNFSGKYTGKGVFTIVEVKMGAGSTKGWGLLKSYERKRNGWISLDYAEKV